ncbi:hypothetical protein CS063_07115 [Sporanaerobium hydrogeniformans]|uniref:Uncharacterized protein n=1 Tax=Sporanaerobium hydrogeniformans TaxID=3072179 RepID=A0AC61DE38_9FIRM|nr:FtsQ-type POTRA domain-containing protein [Sporanaerobium hydrogeniformans]PHV71093.1 hypothetical protein CS063_07115 [Sporanaerobium hydrogeniformans]
MRTRDNVFAKKIMYAIGIVSILMITLSVLPIWQVTKIIVKDSQYYSEEDIKKVLKLEGEPLWGMSKKKLKEQLKKLPYVEDSQIDYSFPGKIQICLIEKVPYGYVPFMGTYLCIDEKGQVIEQVNSVVQKLPIIRGLVFNAFKIGEVLPLESEDALLIAVELINILKKYNYTQKVTGIDIYNLEQIHLYVDNLDVIIGNIQHFEEKLQWLIKIHETHDMGVLNLSQIPNGQVVLSPIE